MATGFPPAPWSLLFDWTCVQCVALGRTFALVLLLRVLSLLLRTFRRLGSVLSGGGRVLRGPRPRDDFRVLVPLAVCASAHQTVVDWSVRRRRKPRSRFTCCPTGGLARMWLWFLLCLNGPAQIWAAPEGLEELRALAATVHHSRTAATALPEHLPSEHGAVAGVPGFEVLAPHYQSEYGQVTLLGGEGSHELVRAAERLAATSFHPDVSVIVPCKPQLFQGYAAIVAQPRCLTTSGTVTVVLDLLAIGGNRFACVLPAFIEDRAIRTFARSLTEVDSQEMRIYVGESWTRQAAGTDLRLDAGDVIKVTTSDTPPAGQPSFEEICRDQHCWCPADQHPRPFLKPGISLLSGDHRYFVNRRQYPQQPPSEVAARTAGIAIDNPLLKVAQPPGLANVLLHGNPCRGVACVMAIPSAIPVPPAPAIRQDNVVFFDVRPLGCKPLCHYQVGNARHVPTVLQSLGVLAPQGFLLSWDPDGADGFVQTESGATIVVRAVLPGPPSPSDGGGAPPDDGPDDGSPWAPNSTSGSRRPSSRSPRRYGGAGCLASTGPSSVLALFGVLSECGFAGKWRCSFANGDVLLEDSCILTSADDGLPEGAAWGLNCLAGILSFAMLSWMLGNALGPFLFEVSLSGTRLTTKRSAHYRDDAGCAVVGGGPVCAKGNDVTDSGRPYAGDASSRATLQGRSPSPTQGRRPVQRAAPDLLVDRPDEEGAQAAVVRRTWHFLVLGHELSKEFVALQLVVPCALPHAVGRVQAARADDRSALYPCLIPVVPQPADTFGTLVCLPTWAQDQAVVCLDARDCDGRIFARLLPIRMNRESLLLAAGFEHDSDICVHLGSSWLPLRPYQLVSLVAGALVSFLPPTSLFRPGVSLQRMLLRVDGWVADPDLPDLPVDRSFWILTDAMPARLLASDTSRDSFRKDVARVLVTDLQPSLPNFGDLEVLGRTCRSVLVATGEHRPHPSSARTVETSDLR